MKQLDSYHSAFLNESVAIDDVLDRAGAGGGRGLTDFEKMVLGTALPNDTMTEFIARWLDERFSDLTEFSTTLPSFGQMRVVVLFVNKDADYIFRFDPRTSILAVSYIQITSVLGQYFDEAVLSNWFERTYDIVVAKVTSFFENQSI